MTVISRKQQNYDYPNSNYGSDTESLQLPSASASDAESVNNEPIRVTTLSILRHSKSVPVYEEFGCLKRHSGKRKQRRFNNRFELQTLAEEDENCSTLVKLMEDYKGPFTRLLENEKALHFWNEFTVLSEEKQAILASTLPKNVVSKDLLKGDDPKLRISAKIKRAMKVKKNLPMEQIQDIEEDLISYFVHEPEGVFVSTPRTSFERLLLHAIAQYHNLKSISYLEDMMRNVEVHVKKSLWSPMEIRFCDFVKEWRL